MRPRAEGNKPRFPLNKAQGVACELLQRLRELHPVERGSIAGSLRRGIETVGDIDLVVASKEPQQASNAFLSLPWKSLRLHSTDKLETKVFTLTYDDIPVDLWIVDPDVYGVALFNRTGSTAYLMKIYKLALDRIYGANWSHDVQEHYAAFLKGDARFRTRAQMKLFLRLVNHGSTELDVFRALELPWVAPALRE